MMNKFDIYTGIHNLGKIDIDDIAQICLLGNISRKDDCWTRILNPVLTKMKKVRFADVCIGENVDITGGERHCIDDVFIVKAGGKNLYHQNVNVPEYTAYGLALEYAKKKGHDVWCKENKEHKNTIRCSTLDNSHFYTFKFNGTNNTDDDTILENTIKGICALQDAKFVDSGFKNITADGHMGLNINWEEKDGCMTQCDASLLDKFALHGKTERRSFKWLDNNLHDFCPVDTLHKFDENLLSKYPGYEYMTNAFENIQFVLDNNLVNTIRTYIELQGIKVSSFTCKYRPVPYQSNSLSNYGRAIDNDVLITVGTAVEMTGEPDDILICELNGKKVDFVFDDLYESKNYEQKAGKAGLACVLVNGTYGSDRNCRNLTKSQCLEASSKISGGTRWDSDSEVCVLNSVANVKTINNVIQLSSGVAIAVGVTFLTGGSAAIAIVAAGSGLLLDTAFIGIEKINELRPAHRARSFAKDVQNCQIPDGTISCSTAQKNCAIKVVNGHFAALEEIFTDLNDDQMNVIGNLMENVTNCLSDEEYEMALQTSTTYATAALNVFSWGLLIGGMFFHPESAANLSRFPKVAKVLGRLPGARMTTRTLNGVEHTRLFLDGVSDARINRIVSDLLKDNYFMSGSIQDGKKVLDISKQNIFSRWDNAVGNWLLDTDNKIGHILLGVNKRAEVGKYTIDFGNGVKHNFYKIIINDNDNVDGIVKALKGNGYFISSGTEEGAKYLYVADEDVLSGFDNIPTNWLKQGIQNIDNVSEAFYAKFPGFKNYDDFFRISNNVFPKIAAEKMVTQIRNDGRFFAKTMPIEGIGGQSERYVIVAISKEDADKIGIVWKGKDLVSDVDNSAFLRNIEFYKNNEITRIGNTSAYIEDVGSIDGRAIVTIRIGNRKIPFYVSSGLAGKTQVPTGKWEIFWGLGPDDEWFNKGSLSGINSHYGSRQLEYIAHELDSKLGDPRSIEYVLSTVGRKSRPDNAGGFVGVANLGSIDAKSINSGFKYAPRNYDDYDALDVLRANQKDIIYYLENLR